ncbi:hypothetical protein DVL52_12180 [Salmonella enterica]|uniref:BIG2 domain-containing protein n=1 Tax=Salmonella enterica subsp. enterica serovar Weltevreden TaxID=57743 RepID=A0A5X3L9Z0_SALET|nr:hypothetical protein [Salmonella enterica subsp. enterica]EAB7031474.1 hypothetical protein [Salmonella enterica subsp. enterica serovar Weltevreden]EBK8544260.1 hypothetical protein [Salmonella enterica]EBQ9580278.1 hypothetical protein [Salmonella enterica subsp. enterica serovar Weltevreden]EBU7239811.1 hypothetical protein [Salmonella enterica subsp. enterica serovar Weltevreden]
MPVPLAWRPRGLFWYRCYTWWNGNDNIVTVSGNGIVRGATIISSVGRDLRYAARCSLRQSASTTRKPNQWKERVNIYV